MYLRRCLQLQKYRQPITHTAAVTQRAGDAPVNADAALMQQLQAALKAKETKIAGYRQIIIKLKEEFIKSEQEHAVTAVKEKDKERTRGGADKDDGSAVRELTELQSQVSNLSVV